jgi:ABC-2 type transport system permease protein
MPTAITPSLTRIPSRPWAELACYSIAVVSWAVLLLIERRADMNLLGKVLLVTMGLGLPIAGLLMDPQRRAVAQRELMSYFFTPVGYVVLAVFTALTGLFFFFFSRLFEPGSAIETNRLFEPMAWWVMVPLTPAISMRLFAEEQRSGNLEALVTAPLTDSQLVLGKWLGALGFLAVTLALSLMLVLLLEVYGSPDYGPIFTGYLGLLLLGGLFLAVGTLASTLTHNQIIAFLATLIFIALFTYINFIVANSYLSGAMAQALKFINPNEHNRNFALGLLDTGDFVFFISAIALFLVLAVKALESRKWR